MIAVAVALFLGVVANAKDCQYFYNDLVGYPVGIERCSYYVLNYEGVTESYSFQYFCTSTGVVTEKTYDGVYDCSGTATSTTVYTSKNGTFECASDYLSCGKLFGGKTPCDCTAADGDCDYAIEISLVDEVCVETDDMSYMWAITCGSVSSANAVETQYADTTDCTGSSTSVTYTAGCHTNTDYINGEQDVIICPANVASFSLTLLMGLILASLSL